MDDYKTRLLQTTPSSNINSSSYFSSNKSHIDDSVKTFAFTLPPPITVDMIKLDKWLQTLLWEKDSAELKSMIIDDTINKNNKTMDNKEEPEMDILRLKALIVPSTSDGDGEGASSTRNRKIVVQAVYEIFDKQAGVEWLPDEVRESRIVIIGNYGERNKDKYFFQISLEHPHLGRNLSFDVLKHSFIDFCTK